MALRPGRVVGRVCGVKHPIATKLVTVCKLGAVLHLNIRSVVTPSDKIVRLPVVVVVVVVVAGTVVIPIIRVVAALAVVVGRRERLGPENGKVQWESDSSSDEQHDDDCDDDEHEAFLALLLRRGVHRAFLRHMWACRAHVVHCELRGGHIARVVAVRLERAKL